MSLIADLKPRPDLGKSVIPGSGQSRKCFRRRISEKAIYLAPSIPIYLAGKPVQSLFKNACFCSRICHFRAQAFHTGRHNVGSFMFGTRVAGLYWAANNVSVYYWSALIVTTTNKPGNRNAVTAWMRSRAGTSHIFVFFINGGSLICIRCIEILASRSF